MWVTLDDLYVLAAQNAIGDRNSGKLWVLTDTLLGYSLLKNQPDSMQDNRNTSCKMCATEYDNMMQGPAMRRDVVWLSLRIDFFRSLLKPGMGRDSRGTN